MRHAREDYNRIQDPAGLIPEDEPVFLIRAQDQSSGAAVRAWAEFNMSNGGDPVLTLAAYAQARLMDAWPKKKPADGAHTTKVQETEEVPPVDRTKLCTTSGDPVEKVKAEQTADTGQHKAYVVLCEDERAKGFVRPYRDAYRHLTCGTITTMGRALAETYARDPKFYGSTFCTRCNAHFPVGPEGQFVWYEMNGTDGPRVGT